MVVSQWSSSEHRVLQSPWCTSAHPQGCPRTARGGARVATATDSTGRAHSELPNPKRHRVKVTTRHRPAHVSHTGPRNLGAGQRLGTYQVPPSPNPRGTSVRRREGSHHIGAEVQGSPWYCYFDPIRAFRQYPRGRKAHLSCRRPSSDEGDPLESQEDQVVLQAGNGSLPSPRVHSLHVEVSIARFEV